MSTPTPNASRKRHYRSTHSYLCCCGKPPRWEGVGVEGVGVDSYLTCTGGCGRRSRPNTVPSAAARDWNWSIRREKSCSRGHLNPVWTLNPKGRRVCLACSKGRVTPPMEPESLPPEVLHLHRVHAQVGWAVDSALHKAGLSLGKAVLLTGILQLRRIRAGDANPTIDTLIRIGLAAGCTPWVVFHPLGEVPPGLEPPERIPRDDLRWVGGEREREDTMRGATK